MTYADAERRLLALPRFADAGVAAYRPGLDRMRALLAALGDPHTAYPALHIAGTNGKGSTASLAAAVARASGATVGLHTSPHLVTLRERMRVDGGAAPETWVAGAVGRIADALDALGPSFFEATVALSLLYFAEREVDLAVVEVGLGGRLDATNVVEPAACAVTHIGLDHTDLLGETLGEIAREKAGIAKADVPLIHAVDGAEAVVALADEAHRRGASVEAVRLSCQVEVVERSPLRVRLATPVRDYGDVEVGLPGAHQAWNAALAVRAAEVGMERAGLGAPPAEAVRRGLREVVALSGLRGRGESWAEDPRVVLDVAHNADGWRAALSALKVPEGGRLWALVGVMADKETTVLADLLATAEATVLAVDLPGDRALSAAALAETLHQRGAKGTVVGSVAEALRTFRDGAGPTDRLLVTGSHLTVAAVLAERTAAADAG